MRTLHGVVVRVRVRQGSGFHAVAELSILSLRVGVANLFCYRRTFHYGQPRTGSKFPFLGGSFCHSDRFERLCLALVGRPGKPGTVADPSAHPSVKTSDDC